MRLSGTGSLIDAVFPYKPKGMQWRTYMLLRQRAIMLEADTWRLWADSGASMAGQRCT
jgi:hypothetical protein